MLKKRKVSKLLFIKSAMEHALHLSDVIAIDSKKIMESLSLMRKNILWLPGFLAPQNELENKKELNLINKKIFNQIRASDFNFRKNISLERKFFSSRLHMYDGKIIYALERARFLSIMTVSRKQLQFQM